LEISPQIVYKVVRERPRRSLKSWVKPEWYSLYTWNIGHLCLKYEVGKITKPAIGGVFCFFNLPDAKSYALSMHSDDHIWVLEGVGVPFDIGENILDIGHNNSQMDLQAFWNQGVRRSQMLKPYGTVVCHDVNIVAPIACYLGRRVLNIERQIHRFVKAQMKWEEDHATETV
jgi:hypothetical protein